MIRLYHNPRCSKSRACLRLLQEASIPVEVIDYTREGLSLELLRTFVTKLTLTELLRQNEPLYKELNLTKADEETILQSLIAYPQLLQRPIAVFGGQVIVARPPQKVLELVNG